MEAKCDIAIIGAGAAGLAAAIFAAERAQAELTPSTRPLPIVLLDGAKTIGSKILVSGGGRCNVTHDHITPDDFFGSRNIVRNVLAAFNEQATVRWMQDLGVELKREETGKLFPVTDSARTVLNALLNRAHDLGVELLTQVRVSDVKREEATSHFVITHANGDLRANRVVLCTGGKSLPRTGSDGAGWSIARRLGHTVTDTWPALVPLVLSNGFFHADVSGLSHEAELSTFVDGKRIDRRTGSLLWTHFGISGPVAMDASRFWVGAQARGQQAELRCRFVPGQSFEQLEPAMVKMSAERPKLSVIKSFAPHLAERLRLSILEFCNIDPALPLSQLSRELRRKLLRALTALPLPVTRDRGWNYAEVTAGGVPLDEIDYRTMQSRKTTGLYLAGEILDCDGRIGGFNFQWAWATGYLAGRAAVTP